MNFGPSDWENTEISNGLGEYYEKDTTYCSVFDELLNEFTTFFGGTGIATVRRRNIPHRRQFRTRHLLILVLRIVIIIVHLRGRCSSVDTVALVVLEHEAPNRQSNLRSETLLSFFSQEVEEEDVELLEFGFRRESEIAWQCGESGRGGIERLFEVEDRVLDPSGRANSDHNETSDRVRRHSRYENEVGDTTGNEGVNDATHCSARNPFIHSSREKDPKVAAFSLYANKNG